MYHMKYTSFFSWAVLASCTFLNNVAAEEIAILGDIPFNIEEIDLTYSETAPPRISFRSPLPTRRIVPPFRPSIEQFDLLPIVKATNHQYASRYARSNRVPGRSPYHRTAPRDVKP